MRSAPITFSEVGLLQMLQTLSLPEALLLPREPGSPADFIQARKEWEDGGLAELDFDGSLKPSPLFARKLYNLTHMQSMLRLRLEGETTYYVRGPVDLLRLVRTSGEAWSLALCPLEDVLRRSQNELTAAAQGDIATQRPGEPEALVSALAETQPETEDRLAVLAEHLRRFYPEGPQTAPVTEGGEGHDLLPGP